MKSKKKLLLLAGLGAAVGYCAATGKGIFNKVHFKKQYNAILNYTNTHCPDAAIGEIFPYKEGWSCHISNGDEQFWLYLIPSENGNFIFEETKM